jgi:hypothetical protein
MNAQESGDADLLLLTDWGALAIFNAMVFWIFLEFEFNLRAPHTAA